MLLDHQRSANLLLVSTLSTINAMLMVFMFTVGAYPRAIILMITFMFSVINLKQIGLVLRIEPISAIYREWTDQQVLFALMTPEQKEQVKKAVNYPKIPLHEIPLTHHQFIGDNAANVRSIMASQMLKRYPKSSVISPGDNPIDKLSLMASVREREGDKEVRKNPIIIFSDNFDTSISNLDSLGIYCFVVSSDQSVPISRKVFDKDATLKTFDADIGIGYFDGSKLKQLS